MAFAHGDDGAPGGAGARPRGHVDDDGRAYLLGAAGGDVEVEQGSVPADEVGLLAELDADAPRQVVEAAVGERHGGGVDAGAEEAAAFGAHEAAQLEDVREVGFELVLEGQLHGERGVVGEADALDESLVQHPLPADLQTAAGKRLPQVVDELGVGHDLLLSESELGGGQKDDGLDADEGELPSGKVAGIAVVEAEAAVVLGGDAAVRVGEEEQAVLADDQGVADVRNDPRLPFGKLAPGYGAGALIFTGCH